MDTTERTTKASASVDQWVSQLSDKRPEVREAAAEAIAQMGPRATEALLRVLDKERQARRLQKRIVVAAGVVWLAVMLLMAITRNSDQLCTFVSLSGCFASFAAVTQKQKDATKVLAQFDDPITVGPLAEALDFGDKKFRESAVKTLTELMPRLRPGHSADLLPEQRAILYRQLRRAPFADPAFSVAILRGLEQVGDENAIPVVRGLAEISPSTEMEERVAKAARECLPCLEQRVADARAASTLLRPSAAPAAGGDLLLRAAAGAPSGDPDMLLRPAGDPRDVEAAVHRAEDEGMAHVQA